MEDIISQYKTLSAVVLLIGIVAIVKTIRQLLEMVAPKLKKQAGELEPKAMYLGKVGMWWNEFILPRLPVVVGALLVLVDRGFFGGENIKSVGGLVLYGASIGWFSGTLYNGLRKTVARTVGLSIPDVTTADSAGDSAPTTDRNS